MKKRNLGKMREVAESIPETREMLEARYRAEIEEPVAYWRKLVERREEAYSEVVKKMKSPGSMAYEIGWGIGVADDIFGEYGREAISHLEAGHAPLAIINHQMAAIEQRLMNDSFHQQSSSLFSRAVGAAQAEVARRYHDQLRWFKMGIVSSRAALEVL